MCDLSICQEALNRDPVLYLDLTEAVRRGEGRLLAATPRGALAAFHNYEKDGQDLGFTMFADDLETAQALLALSPPGESRTGCSPASSATFTHWTAADRLLYTMIHSP